MKAKLVSVTEPKGKPIWFRTYEFECIDCGKHFIRHRFDSRTNPYCGGCQRKYENERQRERIKAKKQMAINDVLDKISTEIEERIAVYDNWQTQRECTATEANTMREALAIVKKYMAESEE